MPDTYYQLEICHNQKITAPCVEGAEELLKTLSRWLMLPGLSWIRVTQNGYKLFEWMR